MSSKHTPGDFQRRANRLARHVKRLREQRDDLLAACERMRPWIGKALADDAFAGTVGPSRANKSLEMADAAIAKAQGNTERVEALIDERNETHDKEIRAINDSLALEDEYEDIEGLLLAEADDDVQD